MGMGRITDGELIMACGSCGARKAKQDNSEYLITYRDGSTERVPTSMEARRKLATTDKGGGTHRLVPKLA